MRTDSLGNPLWQQTYNFGYLSTALSIDVAQDGGFIVAGYSYLTNLLDQNDAIVLKTDSLGVEQWRRRLGTFYNAEGGVAIATRDGGYLVAANRGQRIIGSNVQSRPTLYKLNAAGDSVWQREYGPARWGTGLYTVHEMPDGAFVAAGQQSDPTNAAPGAGYFEGIALKVCPDGGEQIWYRSYKNLTGGRSQNYLRDLQPTPDGGFIGAGFIIPAAPDTGRADAWALRLDANGYDQPGGLPAIPNCVLLGTEAVTPRLAVVNLYPNPSPSGRFSLSGAGGAEALITDALGRVVRRQRVAAGTGPTPLDLSGAPPGVYLLRLRWGDGRIITRKLLK